MDRPLGRRTPTDWTHVDKYPLAALAASEQPAAAPVVLGVNWYRGFDTPEQDSSGRWWIGLDHTNLGPLRGGHCVCVKSRKRDPATWWRFYDQGREGACVGFGASRAMSLLNRRRYYARWLWDKAKLLDEWPDTRPGDDNGTSVRAAMDVLRTLGHVRWTDECARDPDVAARDARAGISTEGIDANRWATTVNEILQAIDLSIAYRLGAVPILNSWGVSFPHLTWMPLDTLQRLLDEDGEAALITDK
jgi:hypothetical protein